MFLGVNIDHIAVLREARAINDPDPLDAVSLLRRAGADQITIHLREDRRHINDDDAKKIIENSHLPVNLECSIDEEVIKKVMDFNPYRITLVPEKREELTTEGGLNVDKNFKIISKLSKELKAKNIELSLFVDPSKKIIETCSLLDVDWIELHTGLYSNIYAMLFSNISRTKYSIKELELPREKLKILLAEALYELKEVTDYAKKLKLKVAAGHGLNYQNVKEITKIEGIEELNIGQSIIARSVFVGLEKAIKEMIGAMK